ncbi:hypothetical protein E2C01_002273 [Portunus trituberculatus]|uniref:Uncharacterized protein n=1 Tax=Portunus trituberculatus TaxID=210409 RepID=A0A5B7CKK7_PORTR|nr:hypothetical protein [Portunus trituberculatus]
MGGRDDKKDERAHDPGQGRAGQQQERPHRRPQQHGAPHAAAAAPRRRSAAASLSDAAAGAARPAFTSTCSSRRRRPHSCLQQTPDLRRRDGRGKRLRRLPILPPPAASHCVYPSCFAGNKTP